MTGESNNATGRAIGPVATVEGNRGSQWAGRRQKSATGGASGPADDRRVQQGKLVGW